LERMLFLGGRSYNELGQLVTKKLHSTDNGSNFKQQLDIRYNIRGWPTRVNNSDLNNASDGGPRDYFGMELGYNNDLGVGTVTPQYNGNISAVKFSTNLGLGAQAGSTSELGYKYSYDPMNRLTASTHVEKNVSWSASLSYHEDNLTYNLNGSPLSVNRKSGDGVTIDQLSYVYNGNQAQKITDASDKTKGFVDGANTGNDYTYDANGNRISDLNKSSTTTYNYLNLPNKMTKSTGENIQFIYDAIGNKLSQSVYNASNALQKKTDYVGEFIYENDALKLIEHEEGRIVPETNGSFTYQYVLKDYLGNERVTFTTKNEQDQSLATLETANAATEQGKFLYYTEAVKVNTPLFDHTNAGTTYYSTRLNGSANERTGLAKSLSVMPGDTVKAEVHAKYLDTNSSNWTTALNNLITSIANSTAPVGTFVDGGAVGSTGGVTAPFGGLLNKGSETGTAPKAYLNYLIFDRNYVLLNGGFVRMSENAREYGQDGAHEKLAAQFVITQPGYVYIYLSNDNAALGGANVETYWDDMKITQVKSPVLQEDFYYPYGAVAKTAIREDAVANDFLYQGKEWIHDLGMTSYDFEWRQYDPWELLTSTIDPKAEKFYNYNPYSWAFDNPVMIIDPDGMSGEVSIDKEKKTITVSSHYVFYGAGGSADQAKQSAKDIQSQWNGANAKVTIDGVEYSVSFAVTGEYKSDLKQDEVEKNTDIKNNYIKVVESGIDVSYMDPPVSGGSNTGVWLKKNIDGANTSTEAHEGGHGMGAVKGTSDGHPADTDLRGKGQAGIMYPRGTAVDAQYTYDPTKGASTIDPTTGARANTMNPAKRQANQGDVNFLGIGKLPFNSSGKANLGAMTNTYHK